MGGPFSFFVAYQGDYVRVNETTDSCCDESVWMHTGKVGVRMVVGAPTLFAQDRQGANTFTFVNLSAPSMYADELD
jgi:hypothetical protein